MMDLKAALGDGCAQKASPPVGHARHELSSGLWAPHALSLLSSSLSLFSLFSLFLPLLSITHNFGTPSPIEIGKQATRRRSNRLWVHFSWSLQMYRTVYVEKKKSRPGRKTRWRNDGYGLGKEAKFIPPSTTPAIASSMSSLQPAGVSHFIWQEGVGKSKAAIRLGPSGGKNCFHPTLMRMHDWANCTWLEKYAEARAEKKTEETKTVQIQAMTRCWFFICFTSPAWWCFSVLGHFLVPIGSPSSTMYYSRKIFLAIVLLATFS